MHPTLWILIHLQFFSVICLLPSEFIAGTKRQSSYHQTQRQGEVFWNWHQRGELDQRAERFPFKMLLRVWRKSETTGHGSQTVGSEGGDYWREIQETCRYTLLVKLGIQSLGEQSLEKMFITNRHYDIIRLRHVARENTPGKAVAYQRRD